MNIIDFELVRKKKIQENNKVMIPIIELIFEMSVEIQFVVTGEEEVSIDWLEQD